MVETAPAWATQVPNAAIHETPAQVGGGAKAPMSWQQLVATVEFFFDTFIGQIAVALGGIEIFGWRPLDFLANWGRDRIADANKAYAAAMTAQSSSNPAIVDQDGALMALANRVEAIENPSSTLVSFSDNMDRTALGSDWTVLTGAVSMASGDYVKGSGSSQANIVYTAKVLGTAKHFAQIRLRNMDFGICALQIMSTTDMSSGVRVQVEHGALTDTVRIYSIVGGSGTSRKQKFANLNTNDVIGLGYNPDTKTYVVYVNNEAFTSWADTTTIVPAGSANRSVGLVLNISFSSIGSRGCGVDNLHAYDWTGEGVLGATVTPPSMAVSLSMPVPVLKTAEAFAIAPAAHLAVAAPIPNAVLPPFEPFELENTNVANLPVPSGATGCYITLIGAGGKGGTGTKSSTSGTGGKGGGGGARIGRSFIAIADLGTHYTLTRGTASGADTVFSSGSVVLTANGGANAGNGGTAVLSGIAGLLTANGSNGGSGGSGSGSGTGGGSNSAGAGSGGGGGGGGRDNGSGTGAAGGTSSGGTPTGLNGNGGKGGNGARNSSAQEGVDGSSYGAGGGGGGGASNTGTARAGGEGAPGYSKIEWV